MSHEERVLATKAESAAAKLEMHPESQELFLQLHGLLAKMDPARCLVEPFHAVLVLNGIVPACDFRMNEDDIHDKTKLPDTWHEERNDAIKKLITDQFSHLPLVCYDPDDDGSMLLYNSHVLDDKKVEEHLKKHWDDGGKHILYGSVSHEKNQKYCVFANFSIGWQGNDKQFFPFIEFVSSKANDQIEALAVRKAIVHNVAAHLSPNLVIQLTIEGRRRRRGHGRRVLL